MKGYAGLIGFLLFIFGTIKLIINIFNPNVLQLILGYSITILGILIMMGDYLIIELNNIKNKQQEFEDNLVGHFMKCACQMMSRSNKVKEIKITKEGTEFIKEDEE